MIKHVYTSVYWGIIHVWLHTDLYMWWILYAFIFVYEHIHISIPSVCLTRDDLPRWLNIRCSVKISRLNMSWMWVLKRWGYTIVWGCGFINPVTINLMGLYFWCVYTPSLLVPWNKLAQYISKFLAHTCLLNLYKLAWEHERLNIHACICAHLHVTPIHRRLHACMCVNVMSFWKVRVPQEFSLRLILHDMILLCTTFFMNHTLYMVFIVINIYLLVYLLVSATKFFFFFLFSLLVIGATYMRWSHTHIPMSLGA